MGFRAGHRAVVSTLNAVAALPFMHVAQGGTSEPLCRVHLAVALAKRLRRPLPRFATLTITDIGAAEVLLRRDQRRESTN
jgi:hypothetical protein